MRSYRFIISGKVQGVSYRRNVSEKAFQNGFSGYVRNLPDGTVEAFVSLADDDFAVFIQILEEGSPLSLVENIEQALVNELFEGDFFIRYD